MKTDNQPPRLPQRLPATWRRMSASDRMLAGYVAFFTVALLLFDAMIVLSLLP